MQTFIRGRFANEAALIALDELNLYREDFFFFPCRTANDKGGDEQSANFLHADIFFFFFVYHGIGPLFLSCLMTMKGKMNEN